MNYLLTDMNISINILREPAISQVCVSHGSQSLHLVLPADIRRDGVVLQKGVWLWSVQQGAELFPSAPSKRVAELLGQFLWRVDQRQVVLHGAAPQRHPQLKLGNCIFTAQQNIQSCCL